MTEQKCPGVKPSAGTCLWPTVQSYSTERLSAAPVLLVV